LSIDSTVASDNLRPPKYPEIAAPRGTRLVDGWLPDIECCGGSGQAVFEYDTTWRADGSGAERLYWQKQPGTNGDKIDITWTDGSGRSFHVAGDLNQDRLITLSTSGVALAAGQPAQATLPRLSLG